MTAISQLCSELNAQRGQTGLSVTDLAERSGVARAAVYRFMNGGDIRMTTFIAMADTLGLDMVLVPKAVNASLQANALASSPAAASLELEPPSGPSSAVEARLNKIKARLGRQSP